MRMDFNSSIASCSKQADQLNVLDTSDEQQVVIHQDDLCEYDRLSQVQMEVLSCDQAHLQGADLFFAHSHVQEEDVVVVMDDEGTVDVDVTEHLNDPLCLSYVDSIPDALEALNLALHHHRVCSTQPEGLPMDMQAATYVLFGSVVDKPLKLRRDAMGDWTSKHSLYRPVKRGPQGVSGCPYIVTQHSFTHPQSNEQLKLYKQVFVVHDKAHYSPSTNVLYYVVSYGWSDAQPHHLQELGTSRRRTEIVSEDAKPINELETSIVHCAHSLQPNTNQSIHSHSQVYHFTDECAQVDARDSRMHFLTDPMFLDDPSSLGLIDTTQEGDEHETQHAHGTEGDALHSHNKRTHQSAIGPQQPVWAHFANSMSMIVQAVYDAYDSARLCMVVPRMLPRDCATATFVVDAQYVTDPKQARRDAYGSWCSKTHKPTSKPARVISAEYTIVQRFYVHPQSTSERRFRKVVNELYENETEHLVYYVICYQWTDIHAHSITVMEAEQGHWTLCAPAVAVHDYDGIHHTQSSSLPHTHSHSDHGHERVALAQTSADGDVEQEDCAEERPMDAEPEPGPEASSRDHVSQPMVMQHNLLHPMSEEHSVTVLMPQPINDPSGQATKRRAPCTFFYKELDPPVGVEEAELSVRYLLPAGVRIYSLDVVNESPTALCVALFGSTQKDRISVARPLCCPEGLRSVTYLVDGQSIGYYKDLFCDSYGQWGRKTFSTKRNFYNAQYETRTCTPVAVPKLSGVQVDAIEITCSWIVRKCVWKHESTQGLFRKYMFLVYDAAVAAESGNEEQPSWVLICYQWLCEPVPIQPRPHGNRKKNGAAYERTLPSVVHRLKQAAVQYPEAPANDLLADVHADCMTHNAGKKLGTSELPRGMSQVHDVRKRYALRHQPNTSNGKRHKRHVTHTDDVILQIVHSSDTSQSTSQKKNMKMPVSCCGEEWETEY